MKYNLNDTERTLLSAYMDGELAPDEVASAERLLSSSDEAQRYLSELRTVEHLSSSALVGVVASDGVSGGVAAKLTGRAIEAAAKKALFTKAASLGTWGIAGTVGVVATAAVGLALSLSSPKEPSTARVDRSAPTAAQPRIAGTPASFVNVDTNNLIVPPMSTSDLVTFAVHGTLPLGDTREQFLTCAPKGSDSLAVRMHSTAPEAFAADEIGAWDPAEIKVLDSMQRVIRTSVLHYANQGIALRADIPTLRLNVIRTLERAAPEMPAQLRARLDRSRTEMMACREMLRSVEEHDAGAGTVRYIEVRAIGENMPEDFMVERPMQVVLGIDRDQVISVNEHSLRTLETFARPLPPPPVFMTQTLPSEQGLISNPAGVRPMQRRTAPAAPRRVMRLGALVNGAYTTEEVELQATSADANDGVDEGDGIPEVRVNPDGSFSIGIQQPRMIIDTGAIQLRRKRAQMELRTADSILRQVRIEISRRVQEQDKKKLAKPQEEQNGTGGDHN